MSNFILITIAAYLNSVQVNIFFQSWHQFTNKFYSKSFVVYTLLLSWKYKQQIYHTLLFHVYLIFHVYLTFFYECLHNDSCLVAKTSMAIFGKRSPKKSSDDITLEHVTHAQALVKLTEMQKQYTSWQSIIQM